jgi:hypothetical protein
MVMNKQVEEIASRHIGQLGGPEHENACHCLVECDHAIVPILISAFEGESDPERQAMLVNVVWQHRNSDALEFLARAVAEPQDQVWKEALDGLVAIGGPRARELLEKEGARLRSLAQVPEERLAWLQEAIDQLGETKAQPADAPDELIEAADARNVQRAIQARLRSHWPLLLLVLCTGLCFTAVFAYSLLTDTHQEAWDALHRAARAMQEYKERTGRWPKSLDDLEDQTLTRYQGVRFQYDQKRLTLPIRFEEEPTLLYRITRGRFGGKQSEGYFSILIAEEQIRDAP